MHLQHKYLVVIAGPTAVGKTSVSIQLARHFNSIIVSADSRQFYKKMSIGTAKPSVEELSEVPHFFIDTKSVNELYGAGHYEKDCIQLLNEQFKEHKVIFLVGGTGLYINAVLEGVDEFEHIPEKVRNILNEEYRGLGLDYLLKELKSKDPEYYDKVDKNNPQRIIRALEVIRFTNKPFSQFLNQPKPARDFTPVGIFLNMDRSTLYKQINDRVDKMMASGLLDEVKKLSPYRECNALKTVGYKELFEYLDGKISLEKAVDLIKQHTRNYAKRQITWFKNQGEFEEFDPRDFDKIKSYIERIVSNGKHS